MSDLSLIQGETFSHIYTIVDTDGNAVNLTGYTLSAFAQPQTQILNSRTQIPIIIETLVAASGTVTVTISSTISEAFTTNNPITLLLHATFSLIEQQTVNGILTSNGVALAEFNSPLLFNSILLGKAAYYDPGDGNSCEWDGLKWILLHQGTASEWHSSDPVATPDLVTTWVAQGAATGEPSLEPGISSTIRHSILTPPILILSSLPNGSW